MGSHRDISAIRSADVFVTVHGAAAANHIFMRNDTALLEIVPRGFAGKAEGFWIKAFFPEIARYADYRVRYFALNVEDPALSRAAVWEETDFGDRLLWERDRCAAYPITSLLATR
jgi:hypothetical protein